MGKKVDVYWLCNLKNFSSDNARNAVIFGVDNSSWSHANNCKNNFLVLGEANTFGTSGNFDAQKEMFSINFSQVKINFCSSLHCSCDKSYFLLTEKKSVGLKLIMVEPQALNGSCLWNKCFLYYWVLVNL